MAHATNRQELLLQNLQDAGCNQQMIDACVVLFQKNNILKLKQLLAGHRRELLDTVHLRQKEIDCLDYLVFMLDKKRI